MPLRLYFDEDSSSRAVLRALRARGVDAQGAVEASREGRPDPDQLEYAAAQGRTLYSFNIGDFHQLHGEWMRQGRSHSGIILAPQQRYSVGEQIRRLLRLVASVTPEEMRNRIEFLSFWD